METKKNTNAKGIIPFIKEFAHAGIFFPAANVTNFMQAANPGGTKIALANLAYSTFLTGVDAAVKRLPDTSSIKKTYEDIQTRIHDDSPNKNILTLAFRFAGSQMMNSLRVTSYSALAIGGFLLASAHAGSSAALFPGLAALFFGAGNFIQSSPTLAKLRDAASTSPLIKAVLHPAVWYGPGYAMTGIGIGGGIALFADPQVHKLASALTFVGIAETVGALGLMASGKVKNESAPFVGVAVGTLFFAASGIITGNPLGAATGILACAGELSLAIAKQKEFNEKNPSSAKAASKIETVLTAPIRAAMKAKLISPTV